MLNGTSALEPRSNAASPDYTYASGFHSLIASGTTPKLIATELDARFIGYGGMLMKSFVAIMAWSQPA